MVKPKVSGETNAERFKRLATIRTKKVLRAMRVLEHCSNRALYAYDSNDVKKIFGAIESELKRAKSKFKESKSNEFQL